MNATCRRIRTVVLTSAFVAAILVPGFAAPAWAAGTEDAETVEATAGDEQLSMPDWMEVDRDASTVTLEITAGATDASNYWNFNGFVNGEARIVVPQGFQVEIRFVNDDPNMAHSLGIDEARSTWPAMIPNPEPVFEGAITSAPTSMTESTQPGESETITFTAEEAGEYAMVCYVPGHATVGMWTYFVVSADGEAGVRTDG